MPEPSVSNFLSVNQAITILDTLSVAPRRVRLALTEAHGLRLAEAIAADRDSPPFEKSLMDGYAVKCTDTHKPLQILQIVGEVAAGREPTGAIQSGQAMSIMTGASLPPGADGVVPVEDVELIGHGQVKILRSTAPSRYIARQGSDCRAGEVVLPVGAMLHAPQLSVAASVGAWHVEVFAPPRVAVLCTGDELVSISETPGPWQIRNSNEIMLNSLLQSLGCQVTSLCTVKDDVSRIRALIVEGMQHDALFVTGGMSMGRYDFVPAILRELKVDTRITKLRIKPGKPFVFGIANGDSRPCYVFGLPGNPLSGYVCTVRLAARLLRRLAGGLPEPRWTHAPLLAGLAVNGPREFYQPALLEQNGVTPLQWKGSADIFTLARASHLLVRDENEGARRPGEIVRLMEV